MTDDTAEAAVPDLTPEELDRIEQYGFSSALELRRFLEFNTDERFLRIRALLSMARRTVQSEQRAKEAEAELEAVNAQLDAFVALEKERNSDGLTIERIKELRGRKQAQRDNWAALERRVETAEADRDRLLAVVEGDKAQQSCSCAKRPSGQVVVVDPECLVHGEETGFDPRKEK